MTVGELKKWLDRFAEGAQVVVQTSPDHAHEIVMDPKVVILKSLWDGLTGESVAIRIGTHVNDFRVIG